MQSCIIGFALLNKRLPALKMSPLHKNQMLIHWSRFKIIILYQCLDNVKMCKFAKKVSEDDQEIPQSQTADNPMAPRGRVAKPLRDTRKTN